MEELLIDYLKFYEGSDSVEIWNYDIDGHICTVKYYVNGDSYERETKKINVWYMLSYLNQKIK